MNHSIYSDSQSIRQAGLAQKISEALEGSEQRLLFSLQSQWVHRYGLETLPKSSDSRMLFTSKERDEQLAFEEEEFVQADCNNEEEFAQVAFLDPQSIDKDEVHELEAINSPFKDLTTLPREPYEEIVNTGEEKKPQKKYPLKSLDSQSDSKVVKTSPPPLPELDRLRRWLPRDENEFKQAS